MKILPLLAAGLLASCQTPLASTTRPVLDVPKFVGEWTIALAGTAGTEDREDPEDLEGPQEWPLVIEEVEPRPMNSMFEQLRIQPREQKRRYRATATLPAAEGRSSTMTFDCQVIEAKGQMYLTFQKALEEDALAYLYYFEVPLQNTVRMELSGDEMRLLMHERRYLWVPMALSGKLEVDQDSETPGIFGALLPSLDAVLDAYERTQDEDWTVICQAKRVGQ